jgi:hypothetical protein
VISEVFAGEDVMARLNIDQSFFKLGDETTRAEREPPQPLNPTMPTRLEHRRNTGQLYFITSVGSRERFVIESIM